MCIIIIDMITPMLQQYNSLKEKYKDCILLFRLGDFYEGFYDDAKTLSKVLGLTLTGRGVDENRTPMAGIPFHALPTYLPKLIAAGYKVAIADQLEDCTPGLSCPTTCLLYLIRISVKLAVH